MPAAADILNTAATNAPTDAALATLPASTAPATISTAPPAAAVLLLLLLFLLLTLLLLILLMLLLVFLYCCSYYYCYSYYYCCYCSCSCRCLTVLAVLAVNLMRILRWYLQFTQSQSNGSPLSSQITSLLPLLPHSSPHTIQVKYPHPLSQFLFTSKADRPRMHCPLIHRRYPPAASRGNVDPVLPWRDHSQVTGTGFGSKSSPSDPTTWCR